MFLSLSVISGTWMLFWHWLAMLNIIYKFICRQHQIIKYEATTQIEISPIISTQTPTQNLVISKSRPSHDKQIPRSELRPLDFGRRRLRIDCSAPRLFHDAQVSTSSDWTSRENPLDYGNARIGDAQLNRAALSQAAGNILCARRQGL